MFDQQTSRDLFQLPSHTIAEINMLNLFKVHLEELSLHKRRADSGCYSVFRFFLRWKSLDYSLLDQ